MTQDVWTSEKGTVVNEEHTVAEPPLSFLAQPDHVMQWFGLEHLALSLQAACGVHKSIIICPLEDLVRAFQHVFHAGP